MKTITESQYLYLKAKKHGASLNYKTKEISDEEYEDLIQYSNKTITPINNDNPGTEEPENPEPEEPQDDHDYSQDYLTFEALEDGTFSFTNNDLYYSTNNGVSWKSLAAGTSTELIIKGTKVLWKGNITNNINNISHFRSTGKFNILGNIMSLYYDSNFIGQIDITEKYYAFTNLFYNCSKLINAKYLVLPAIILEQDCYNGMFAGCTSLITAPKLPATTLEASCYQNMFSGCTSLTTAPKLPATTLAESCYNSMFSGCTSLLSPIELPATTLSANCYLCMFYGCKKINYIKILILSLENYNGSLFNFLTLVSKHGIFVKYKNNINLDTHIPFGWTVQEIDPVTGEIVNEYINE